MSKIIGGKEFEAVDASSVGNNSLFLDSSDSVIKQKNNSGDVQGLGTIPYQYDEEAAVISFHDNQILNTITVAETGMYYMTSKTVVRLDSDGYRYGGNVEIDVNGSRQDISRAYFYIYNSSHETFEAGAQFTLSTFIVKQLTAGDVITVVSQVHDGNLDASIHNQFN